MSTNLLRTLHESEEGHAIGLAGPLVAAAGAVMLGFGAANGSDGLSIGGGIVAAVGLLASSLLQHTRIEYPIYHRLDELEKK